MTNHPIACELHDYLEIACLYKYKVRLYLNNREPEEGEAVDVITQDKIEYLAVEYGGQRQLVPLSDLEKLEVLTPNAQFQDVKF